MKKSLLKFISIISIISFLALSPMIALADHANCPDGFIEVIEGNDHFCDPIPVSNIWDFILRIQDILNSIIPVLIALGLVYFVWGVVRYVIADSEEAKKKGKDIIIYGIIGFAVIIALWGLVFILVNTFDLNTTAPAISTLGTGTDPTCTLIGNPNPTFKNLLCYITSIINDAVIPLIFALAVAVFVWGAVRFFIINADDEKKREQGRQFMIWGIVALAAMISVWGLVAILGATFDFDISALPQVTPPPP